MVLQCIQQIRTRTTFVLGYQNFAKPLALWACVY